MRKTLGITLLLSAMHVCVFCANDQPEIKNSPVEEITFHSGHFKIVGDLRLPDGDGPHPVVVFVHGDGPNSRTSGGTYPPIMDRMHRAGFATFAWDKPGTGESTGEFNGDYLLEQRAKIVLDAIEILKSNKSIDGIGIGLWGISQAGYVIPLVLAKSNEVAFVIAVSCPGEAGFKQGAYLVAAQAECEGLSQEEAEQFEQELEAVETARTYEDYVAHKTKVFRHKELVESMGMQMRWVPEDEWGPPDPEGNYFFDPISIIERITVPVLAFFGERDTQVDPIQGMQAYEAALERAGNKNFRIELIPGVDHCMVVAKTGCLKEIFSRSREERLNHGKLYLDIIEEWLSDLKSGEGWS